MRNNSRGGVLVITDNATDLEKLKAEVERSGLGKDHSVSKPEKRNPEIIGVNTDMKDDDFVESFKNPNSALSKAELTLRIIFRGKNGRKAIVSLDLESYRRFNGFKRLNVGWNAVYFGDRRQPLQCYRCWKYGHTQKVSRSTVCCGNCGSQEHIRKDCTEDSLCPNCTRISMMSRAGKALPTGHAAGSSEGYVFRNELALLKRRNHGK